MKPSNNKVTPVIEARRDSIASYIEAAPSSTVTREEIDPVEWISTNIQMRICNRYVDPNARGICKCGHLKQEHTTQAKSGDPNEDSWDPNANTLSIPTNAFGTITFENHGSSQEGQYVRLDNHTNMEYALRLLMEVWGLDQPNLLISVTGGAKTFALKPKLVKAFSDGLMKAAQSTGAWIVTGGSHAGVMKLVGEAVKDYSAAHGAKKKVTALGIAPWGCVAEKSQLINEGMTTAFYQEPKNIKPNETTLDPNHSHFLLVDNGTQHKFATEIPFRAKIEKAISEMKTDTGQDAVTVPVVCVVLEGGPGTLETVKSAIQNGTPSVIVEGSGRAADILAYAYANSKEEEILVTDSMGQVHKRTISIVDNCVWDTVREMIISVFKEERNIETRLQWVKDCFHRRDHITVFKMDGSSSCKDLDQALLQSMLKVNKDRSIDQLRLALAWNRIDIAREKIFNQTRDWESEEIHEVMNTAIQHDRVDFVRTLLENAVNLKEFLTIKRLILLYNTLPHNSLLYNLLKQRKQRFVSLKDVGKLIRELVGDFYQSLYLKTKKYRYANPDYFIHGVKPKYTKIGLEAEIERDEKSKKFRLDFFKPARELFIWSVLMNRKELAMLFWDKGTDSIAAALTAQRILISLLEETDDSEIQKEIENNISHFEGLAVGILGECYSEDERKAQLMLVREIPTFGETTILSLAVAADNKSFIAHAACQALLNNIWKGRINLDLSHWRIWACIICPPLIFIPFMKFRGDDFLWKAVKEAASNNDSHSNKSKQPVQASVEDITRKDSTAFLPDPMDSKTLVEVVNKRNAKNKKDSLKGRKNLSFFQKIIAFYNAPVVTFMHNCISYIVFLLLYSYILLTDFDKDTSPIEYVLIFWVLTLLLEEVRQVIMDDGTSVHIKLLSYITDIWNILDFLALITFTIGYALKWINSSTCSDCFEASRVVLAVNLMLFYFRLLHIFSIHKNLGPKLVMIGRMMVDLSYFFVILLVFILAYGLATHAILYPNSNLSITLVKDILHKAYFQIYGELFLEEIQGQAECGGTTGVRCPTSVGKWFVPILLAIYVLFANVLMLNLLIAIFSYTFDKVQENTDIFWYSQRYGLIKEYYEKPALTPPFVFLAHVFLSVRYFWRLCTKRGHISTSFRIQFDKSKSLEEQEKQIIIWEQHNVDDYMKKQRRDEKDLMENRVKDIDERVESIADQVDDIAESSFVSSKADIQTKLPPAFEERINYLEAQMKRTARGLDWIIDALAKGGNKPNLPDVDEVRKLKKKEQENSAQEEIKRMQERLHKQLELHVKSRSQVYPNTTIYRLEVPDNKVLWDEEWADYNPVKYTYDEVLQQSKADPNIIEMSVEERKSLAIKFNAMDGDINRISYVKTYDVIDGLPLNPKGRTGMIGRGKLWRWGPNHAGDPIVTRWARDESGTIKTDQATNKPILEFIASQREDNKQLSIPGAILSSATTRVQEILKADFAEEVFGSLMDEAEKNRTITKKLDEIFSNGEEIYKGYADDPRNTDNAWLETVAFNYHDEDGAILSKSRLRAGEKAAGVTWQKVSSKTPLYGAHVFLLQKVAKKHNAYF